jgi:hypothetical protein
MFRAYFFVFIVVKEKTRRSLKGAQLYYFFLPLVLGLPYFAIILSL